MSIQGSYGPDRKIAREAAINQNLTTHLYIGTSTGDKAVKTGTENAFRKHRYRTPRAQQDTMTGFARRTNGTHVTLRNYAVISVGTVNIQEDNTRDSPSLSLDDIGLKVLLAGTHHEKYYRRLLEEERL
jgi:hypothetical protein